ncbi:MAG: LysR family transcriptional regulator [Pseudomonadota bacterium]
MDINQARTFLEVAGSGSFIDTANRMHLTQTAVSARIRTLEQQLGRRLFVRNKAGARLTPAGERFLRHAASLVQIWERARQQAALPPGREDGLGIGGEFSLWQPLLADWLIWMRHHCPEIALHAEVDHPTRLLDRVQEGSLDMAVLYNPPQRAGLVTELLSEEKLILITSSPDLRMIPDQYIYVDWGPNFAANHQAAYPDLTPPVSMSFGPLALTYLLTVGGAGYFRIGTAQPLLAAGLVHRVSDAPEFSHSAYVVYAAQVGNSTMDRALAGMRKVAAVSDRPGLGHAIAARPLPPAGLDEPGRRRGETVAQADPAAGISVQNFC